MRKRWRVVYLRSSGLPAAEFDDEREARKAFRDMRAVAISAFYAE